MGRTRNKQAGFNIVELLVIIVAVGVIGVGGWFVYQHNRTEPTGAVGGTQTNNQNNSQQTTTTTPGATVGYLEIKEWGVKMPLTSAISSAKYVVSTSFSNDPDGLPSGVWLGLTSLSDASCNPANNNMGNGTGAIGDILRVPQNATDPVSGQPYSQKYPNGVTLNGYYYGYQSWMNDNSCTQKSTAQAADSAFASAAKGIVATSTTTN
jgi:hypothetical protein